MMVVTVVEPGDVVVIQDPKRPNGVNIQDSKYYIPNEDGSLQEVSWLDASDYQKRVRSEKVQRVREQFGHA